MAAFGERAISAIVSFYLYCSLDVKQGYNDSADSALSERSRYKMNVKRYSSYFKLVYNPRIQNLKSSQIFSYNFYK